MSIPAIHAENVHKAYGAGATRTPVLKGIDIDIMPGECVFLVGPSGSGKSTLLSILGCILTPDSGVVNILGEDVTCLRPKQQARFRRERIGFVFQRFHLFRGLTAAENVRLSMHLAGYSKTDSKQEACRLLEAVGLKDKISSQVTKLSMGQRQRVALARALAPNPELILADEPTASLDAHSGLRAMGLLRELTAAQNKTVIVVTHDSRIFHFADRILHLDDGRVTAVTNANETAMPHFLPASP